MTEYKILMSDSGNNTALAAGSKERIIAEPVTKEKEFYNYMEVFNRDNVDYLVMLDGQDTGIKAKPIPANTIGVLEVEEGILFKSVWIKNLHASTAGVADKLKIDVMFKEAT